MNRAAVLPPVTSPPPRDQIHRTEYFTTEVRLPYALSGLLFSAVLICNMLQLVYVE